LRGPGPHGEKIKEGSVIMPLSIAVYSFVDVPWISLRRGDGFIGLFCAFMVQAQLLESPLRNHPDLGELA